MNAPITVEATADQLRIRRPPDLDRDTWRRIKEATLDHLNRFVDELEAD